MKMFESKRPLEDAMLAIAMVFVCLIGVTLQARQREESYEARIACIEAGHPCPPPAVKP